MAGKKKVFIQIEAVDKGSPTVKTFDKNTERAFDNMKRNAGAASTGMGALVQRMKSCFLRYKKYLLLKPTFRRKHETRCYGSYL
ncbi:MAG: hypothetical protein JRF50_12925 [Deltaproteobacteria bacterium]|nr:hypothetical protein [Deltaproteobacteria bacterium]